eukprot:gene579-3896_t
MTSFWCHKCQCRFQATTSAEETRCPTCSDNIIEELSLETDESPTSHPPLQTEPDHNEAHRQTHARHLQFIQNINLPHGRWPHNTVGRERQNSTPHAHQQQVTFRAHPGQPFAFHGGGSHQFPFQQIHEIVMQTIPVILQQFETPQTQNYNPSDLIDQLAETSLCSDDTEIGEQCAVCLQPFEVGQQARRLPCTHTFHSECIDAWLETAPTCPTCRTNISNQLDELSLQPPVQ